MLIWRARAPSERDARPPRTGEGLAFSACDIWRPTTPPAYAKQEDMTESKLRIARSSIALSAAVFITASVSILLTRDNTAIAAVWVANALILATLLRHEKRVWPVLLAAAYVANALANLATGNGWIIAIFASAANVVEILVCGWALTRGNTPQFEAARGRDFLRLLIGAALGGLASSIIATIAISFHNDVAVRELFVSWFVSDSLGLLIFTPTFAVLLGGTWRDALRGPQDAQRALLYWAAFVAGLAIIFGQSAIDLLPVAPLLVILVAFVFEASSVALAVTVISCVAISATAMSIGPESMTQGSVTYRLYHLQGFLALLVFSGMPAAIALSQRRRLQESLLAAHDDAVSARDELAMSEGRLQAIAAAARDIIVQFKLDTTMTYVSPASTQVLGYKPSELVGRRTSDFVHPDDVERAGVALKELIAAGPDAPTSKMRLRTRHKDGSWRWIEGRPRATFDHKTGRVKALYDVMRDVTEEQEMAEALHQARERAEAAVKAKSEFLANMSHELRTPLNSVVGFSRLLAQSGDLSERNRRFASLIESSSRATLSIVNDVLDVSAIERGALALRLESASLAEVLSNVRDMITPDAAAKGLSIELFVDPALAPRHIVDGDRLRQVLLNLASNAVKFTRAGGVYLRAERLDVDARQETVRFSVRDTGVGIALEHQGDIFERFTQVADGVNDGAGLGLSIARSLVKLMGGAISVDSSPGRGATFAFTVAAAIAAPVEAHGEECATILPARRVLVVDDVDLNRELVRRILEEMGHVVETVASGEEAIEKCGQDNYDLILMDVRMPGLDGLTATRVIRRGRGPGAYAPIIALSAGALPEQVSACLEAGMNDHLAKPVNPEELIAAMARWAGEQGTRPSPAANDLRQRFRERLREDRARLTMWRDTNALPQEVQPVAHRLAGSAGSFGFEAIGERAGLLNDAIERSEADWRPLLEALIAAFEAEASKDSERSAA